MKRRLWLAIAGALALAPAANAASLDAAQVKQLQALAPGRTLTIEKLGIGAKALEGVVLKRIDVYAPDAKIYVAGPQGLVEAPRSDWTHYLAESVAGNARFGFSISADGREASGTLMADGRTYPVRGRVDKRGLVLETWDPEVAAKAKREPFVCSGAIESMELGAPSPAPHAPHAKGMATRSAIVAVDTDNELLQFKFADNTTTATTYLATLFVTMNVIYERDLDLTLLQGTTILRPTSQPDPYPSPVDGDIGDQLDEFRAHWSANQGGVSRAFAMQLSGKLSSQNSAEGLATVLANPNVNYCSATGTNGGHYSVSRVFRNPAFPASFDTSIVAHELGHNFGVSHTHCTDAGTGAQPVAANTIDQCFNGESGQQCYAGAQACPAPATVNGVPGVTGTLMSYCHLNGIVGCDSFEVFADRNRATLLPKVANNVTNGCFAGVAAGTIFANGFE